MAALTTRAIGFTGLVEPLYRASVGFRSKSIHIYYYYEMRPQSHDKDNFFGDLVPYMVV